MITQEIQRKIDAGWCKIEVFRRRMATLFLRRLPTWGEWSTCKSQPPPTTPTPAFAPRMKKVKGIVRFSSGLH